MTKVDREEYTGLLGQLKRNRENIPLNILQTKYGKPYRKLEEDIKCMTESLLREVVFHGLLIERDYAAEAFGAINKAIEVSGLLSEISHAAFKHYSTDQVMELAEELRLVVHQTVKGVKEAYGG